MIMIRIKANGVIGGTNIKTVTQIEYNVTQLSSEEVYRLTSRVLFNTFKQVHVLSDACIQRMANATAVSFSRGYCNSRQSVAQGKTYCGIINIYIINAR